MTAVFGFFAGIIGGMGIGGGALLIPALTLILGFEQKKAQVINLLFFIPTAVFAIIDHRKNGRIENGVTLPIILWGSVGCILGAVIALWLKSALLGRIFGGFMLVMGVLELRKAKISKIDK